jgi:hypothetical protein
MILFELVYSMPMFRFPSSFVLQGSGLTPAPKTIRVSQAMVSFQSFIRLLEGLQFTFYSVIIYLETNY